MHESRFLGNSSSFRRLFLAGVKKHDPRVSESISSRSYGWSASFGFFLRDLLPVLSRVYIYISIIYIYVRKKETKNGLVRIIL